jgi:hypothetical protein
LHVDEVEDGISLMALQAVPVALTRDSAKRTIACLIPTLFAWDRLNPEIFRAKMQMTGSGWI